MDGAVLAFSLFSASLYITDRTQVLPRFLLLLGKIIRTSKAYGGRGAREKTDRDGKKPTTKPKDIIRAREKVTFFKDKECLPN